ncbi:MAG: YihY/virulence factor BrkB family protein [Solirubrobacterales bacterium]|nr:YihY/virulence factor BrkB family protein [Solirubrobacterales bacterium]
MAAPALLLIAVWILGEIFGTREVRAELVGAIMDSLPIDEVDGRQQIADSLDSLTRGAGGLGLFSILVLIYSGSGAVGAVRQAVESAQGDAVPGRSFPRSKVFDVAITSVTLPVLLLIVAIALSRDLSALVESEAVLDFLARFPGGGLAYSVIGLLLLAWLYWVLNPGPRTATSSMVGALTAATLCSLVWVALKFWFGVTGGGAAVFGALAAFLGLLLFLNLACLAVVFGAHIAASFRSHRDGREVSPDPVDRIN